jgi:hypothetical protein
MEGRSRDRHASRRAHHNGGAQRRALPRWRYSQPAGTAILRMQEDRTFGALPKEGSDLAFASQRREHENPHAQHSSFAQMFLGSYEGPRGRDRGLHENEAQVKAIGSVRVHMRLPFHECGVLTWSLARVRRGTVSMASVRACDLIRQLCAIST